MSNTLKGCPINVSKAKYGCVKSPDTQNFRSSGGILPIGGYINWYVDAGKISETLNYDEIVKGTLDALEYISPHMGNVKFKQVKKSSLGQITIGFYKNDDSEIPQKFESNVLAYAYLSTGTTALDIEGDMYFNDEHFNWALKPSSTEVDFTRICLHEILHALSLFHQSFDNTGILYPSYNPNVPIRLTQDTINGLTSIYSMFEGPVEVPVDPPTEVPPEVCPKHILKNSLKKILTDKNDLNRLLETSLVTMATELGLESDVRFKKSYTIDLIWQHLQN